MFVSADLNIARNARLFSLFLLKAVSCVPALREPVGATDPPRPAAHGTLS